MAKNDGGPAFPNVGDNSPEFPFYDGMTLRDWFAAHAPPIPELEALMHRHDDPEGSSSSVQVDAAYRYRHADAMLAARGKVDDGKE